MAGRHAGLTAASARQIPCALAAREVVSFRQLEQPLDRRGYVAPPFAQAVKIEVDDRRGEEGEELRDEEAADDGDAERLAQFRAAAPIERHRQGAEQRGE